MREKLLDEILKTFSYFLLIVIFLLATSVVAWGIMRLGEIDRMEEGSFVENNTPYLIGLQEYKNDELGFAIRAPEGGGLSKQSNRDDYLRVHTSVEKDGETIYCAPEIYVSDNLENLSLSEYVESTKDDPLINYITISSKKVEMNNNEAIKELIETDTGWRYYYSLFIKKGLRIYSIGEASIDDINDPCFGKIDEIAESIEIK